MSINEQIKSLYECYFKYCKIPIAYDGIVNEVVFSVQAHPTLFLLKDANPDAREDGNANVQLDLYETANTQKPEQIRISTTTWRNVCRWSKLIAEPGSNEADCWNKNGDFDIENMRKYLNRIAVVNIKKTFGKGVNENRAEYSIELVDAVTSYYPLVKEEIDLINPQIIVCGGTFDYILPMYFSSKKDRNATVHRLSSGARYFIDRNRIYLDFDHPGSRTSPKILFAYFKETINSMYRELLSQD